MAGNVSNSTALSTTTTAITNTTTKITAPPPPFAGTLEDLAIIALALAVIALLGLIAFKLKLAR